VGQLAIRYGIYKQIQRQNEPLVKEEKQSGKEAKAKSTTRTI